MNVRLVSVCCGAKPVDEIADGAGRCSRCKEGAMFEPDTWTEDEDAKAKVHIDGMSQLEMARLWRFAPAGHPYFVAGSPLADYFSARFQGFTPEISKMLG